MLKRKSQLRAVIDVSGLAAVMLFLVVLFMARILLYTDLPSGQVDLVRASHATELSGAMREDATVVSVTREGGVYLDSQAIPLGQLANEIWKHFNGGAEKKVYVKADARARYADVAAVLDVLRAAKIQHIALITD